MYYHRRNEAQTIIYMFMICCCDGLISVSTIARRLNSRPIPVVRPYVYEYSEYSLVY